MQWILTSGKTGSGTGVSVPHFLWDLKAYISQKNSSRYLFSFGRYDDCTVLGRTPYTSLFHEHGSKLKKCSQGPFSIGRVKQTKSLTAGVGHRLSWGSKETSMMNFACFIKLLQAFSNLNTKAFFFHSVVEREDTLTSIWNQRLLWLVES